MANTKKGAAPTKEPQVSPKTPMPPGYKFVPKGNVYVTGNCRRMTQASGATVYVVVDGSKSKRPLGIRVPSSVAKTVKEADKESRAGRAAKVQARDKADTRSFEGEVQRLFPRMPAGTAAKVARHALVKHSRRVGRTGKIGLEEKVKRAVVAHIRHVHTNYEKLLKEAKMEREKARKMVWPEVKELAEKWAGKEGVLDHRRGKTKKKRNSGSRQRAEQSAEKSSARRRRASGKNTSRKSRGSKANGNDRQMTQRPSNPGRASARSRATQNSRTSGAQTGSRQQRRGPLDEEEDESEAKFTESDFCDDSSSLDSGSEDEAEYTDGGENLSDFDDDDEISGLD